MKRILSRCLLNARSVSQLAETPTNKVWVTACPAGLDDTCSISLKSHAFEVFDMRESNLALIHLFNVGFVFSTPLTGLIEDRFVFSNRHSEPGIDRENETENIIP